MENKFGECQKQSATITAHHTYLLLGILYILKNNVVYSARSSETKFLIKALKNKRQERPEPIHQIQNV